MPSPRETARVREIHERIGRSTPEARDVLRSKHIDHHPRRFGA